MIDWTSVDEYACSNLDVTKYGSLVIVPNKLMQVQGLIAMWNSIKAHESDWMSDIQEFAGIPTGDSQVGWMPDFRAYEYEKQENEWDDITEVDTWQALWLSPKYDPNHDFFD